jgi:hypothetical protein
MLLLTGLMSNAEKAKKLDDHDKGDRLFNFFNIQLGSQIKFGKHQIFEDCASDCEAEAKTKLRACGKEIQKIVQLGREKATEQLVLNSGYKHAAKTLKFLVKRNGRSSAVKLHCTTF